MVAIGPHASHQGAYSAKGRTARKLFEEYPRLKKRYWGRHLWARGYFCVTARELTKEQIEEYLSHHFERRDDDQFEVE